MAPPLCWKNGMDRGGGDAGEVLDHDIDGFVTDFPQNVIFLIVLVPRGVRSVHYTLQLSIGHGANLVLQRWAKLADRRDQAFTLSKRPGVADADGHRLGTLGRGQETSIGGQLLVGGAREIAVEL